MHRLIQFVGPLVLRLTLGIIASPEESIGLMGGQRLEFSGANHAPVYSGWRSEKERIIAQLWNWWNVLWFINVAGPASLRIPSGLSRWRQPWILHILSQSLIEQVWISLCITFTCFIKTIIVCCHHGLLLLPYSHNFSSLLAKGQKAIILLLLLIIEGRLILLFSSHKDGYKIFIFVFRCLTFHEL